MELSRHEPSKRNTLATHIVVANDLKKQIYQLVKEYNFQIENSLELSDNIVKDGSPTYSVENIPNKIQVIEVM